VGNKMKRKIFLCLESVFIGLYWVNIHTELHADTSFKGMQRRKHPAAGQFLSVEISPMEVLPHLQKISRQKSISSVEREPGKMAISQLPKIPS